MADTNTILQFLDLAGTTELKNQLVSYIDKQDAEFAKDSIKGVGIDGNVLSFYKTLPIDGATAAYEIELPETEIDHLMALVTGAVEDDIAVFDALGQVRDSGKKLSDFYVATKVDELLGAIEAKVDKNTEDISTLSGSVNTRLETLRTELEDLISGNKEEADGRMDSISEEVNKNTASIGTLEDLETAGKTDLVTAINEVRNAVSAGGTEAQVTMTESASDDYAKVYTFKQGENTIGSVNIPKDMVVQSGEVVTNPTGQPSGTYLKLVLANSDNTELFVNVGTLVDIYKAEADATQVQLTIDSSTREISARIVSGSITATEIADNSILTRHMGDGNVTKAKLSTGVQESLDRADAAATAEDLNQEIQDRTTAVSGLDTRIKSLEEAIGDGGNVDDKIDSVADQAKAYTDDEVAKINAKIGTVPEGKNLVGMIEEATYDDTDIQAAVAANTKNITDLTATYTTDKKALDAKDTEHDEAIAQNAADISDIETALGNIQAIPVAKITEMFA